MTSNESAHHAQSQSTDDQDTIESRTKSVDEIRDAVANNVETMDGNSTFSRLLIARYRRHFTQASGRVLDVACGTGTNLQYLPDDVEYVGVDISPLMLSKATDRFDHLTRGESLQEMDAQDLSFDDDNFDTVISSMSTCMFPDPVTALQEMGRVCKPDGQVLLLEHGRSSVGPIAWAQDKRADRRYEKTGCRWDQEPLAVVTRSDLVVEAATTGLLGMVTAITARPPCNST